MTEENENSAPVPIEKSFGVGELMSDPHHVRGDMRLIETAINRQWKIPEEAFEELPAIIWKQCQDPDARIAQRGAQLLEKLKASNEPSVKAHLHKHQVTYDQIPEGVDFDQRKANNAARIASLKRLS